MKDKTPILSSLKRTAGGRFVKSYRATFELPDGGTKDYELVSRKDLDTLGTATNADAVTIFAVSDDGEHFLVTDEFRYPVNGWTISVPSGLIDEGEMSEDAAIRELREETGYDQVEVTRILPATYSSVGITDESVQPVVVRVNRDSNAGTRLGEAELIRYRWVDREEALRIAETATNVTARTQLALLLFAAGQLGGTK